MRKKLIRLFLILGLLIISTGVLLSFAIYLYSNITNRNFSTEEIYTVTYPEGDVNLYVRITISPPSDPGMTGCYANVQFSSFTDGDLEINGISYVKLNIYKDGNPVSFDEINLSSPPIYWVSYNSIGAIYKDNNVTVIGQARINYKVNDTNYDELFHYQISIVLPTDMTGRFYTETIPFIWIEFIVILGLILSVGFIIGVVNSIRIEYLYSQEEREKDKKFWDYLRQKRNQ